MSQAGIQSISGTIGDPVTVPHGGTGVTSLTQHGFVIGNGTSPVNVTAAPTNGQLPIGSTGNDPVLATLTPGTGIAITNGAGSITISASGSGFVWNDVTGATQTLAVENGYVTDRAGGVTYTLPATAAFGDEILIAGKSGAWSVVQNANQQILLGSSSSTVGVGGSIASTNVGDCVHLLCITAGASTVWRALNFVGNITVT